MAIQDSWSPVSSSATQWRHASAMREISETDFYEGWGAQVDATGDLLCFEEIRHRPEHAVWTIVDSGDDDGNWYAVPGIHHVNALGYITTAKAWDDPHDAGDLLSGRRIVSAR